METTAASLHFCTCFMFNISICSLTLYLYYIHRREHLCFCVQRPQQRSHDTRNITRVTKIPFLCSQLVTHLLEGHIFFLRVVTKKLRSCGLQPWASSRHLNGGTHEYIWLTRHTANCIDWRGCTMLPSWWINVKINVLKNFKQTESATILFVLRLEVPT